MTRPADKFSPDGTRGHIGCLRPLKPAREFYKLPDFRDKLIRNLRDRKEYVLQTILSRCLAHASYLIGSDGEAAVVDPQRDVDEYLAKRRAGI
jgi:hypothetical protein